MSSTSTSTNGGHPPLHSPAGAFASVLSTAVGMGVAKLEQKVAEWTGKADGATGEGDSSTGLTAVADEGLDEIAEEGGAAQSAGAEGVKASLHGKNPIWGAVKGAWESGTPVMRAAIITGAVGAVVLLLLSPVLLVVFLLSLLIVAAASRARPAQT